MEYSDYISHTVAVGVVMMDEDGYDNMMVFHGTIAQHDEKLYLEYANEEPFEMSEKWLAKLKPVDKSMSKEFQGSKYCLIIASVTKP